MAGYDINVGRDLLPGLLRDLPLIFRLPRGGFHARAGPCSGPKFPNY